jgi:hypothetical protein
METIVTYNQVSAEGLFINYHKSSQKEDDFLDCACFIVDTAIHNFEDMGFLRADDYHEGNFDNAAYETGEDVWKVLFNAIGVEDYEEFEDKFESVVAWEDNDNTCIAKIAGVEYAILRM